VTRLNVAGLLREPAGTGRTVELGPLDWTDPTAPGGRRLLGSLRLLRTNRGIVVDGRVRTLARRTCIRCLDEFDEPVEVVIREEFLPSVDPTTGAGPRLRCGIYLARFNVEGQVHTRRFALLN